MVDPLVDFVDKYGFVVDRFPFRLRFDIDICGLFCRKPGLAGRFADNAEAIGSVWSIGGRIAIALWK